MPKSQSFPIICRNKIPKVNTSNSIAINLKSSALQFIANLFGFIIPISFAVPALEGMSSSWSLGFNYSGSVLVLTLLTMMSWAATSGYTRIGRNKDQRTLIHDVAGGPTTTRKGTQYNCVCPVSGT